MTLNCSVWYSGSGYVTMHLSKPIELSATVNFTVCKLKKNQLEGASVA